ncbi:hypothetical protein C8R41DRAFT_927449 [Lentinula lateritia]|uniref:Uncharacterized protein n=1 Tax=Lentinula lateritia TaxID=40482 RepID=A0ABQ8UVX8_9AGAR|nr:hypothetical protein C8R41DRAFT_927449 [Lentinula lateritia]
MSAMSAMSTTMQILSLPQIWIWVFLHFISLTVAPDVATSLNTSSASTSLLDAFRAHYAQFEAVVTQVHMEPTDPFLLQLLGEDLNQFAQLSHENATIFKPEEAQILQSSLQMMILDIRALYEQRIEA